MKTDHDHAMDYLARRFDNAAGIAQLQAQVCKRVDRAMFWQRVRRGAEVAGVWVGMLAGATLFWWQVARVIDWSK